MICYPHQLTYTDGEYKTAHHVNCVTELEAWSTYYRHAAQHSRKADIDGAMTKCFEIWQTFLKDSE
ncbi:hypothetical protein DPMN_034679 [Dreissena polymorpha]|uniref:Uncharacterized protein n=1 Tax=Dreissena polymorpha TaxID=45954 RepID=A0A9D4M8A5_DREPO|nr:hypothetical protein DPMN_034679 [Dreissena polymorpha]